MGHSHHYRGVAWAMLVSMVWSPLALAATPATPGSSGRFLPPTVRSQHYITIPANPIAAQPKPILNIKIIPPVVIPNPSVSTPTVSLAAPQGYTQLRAAAVIAEKNAQNTQMAANQATAALNAQSTIFENAVEQAGLASMFNEPASTADTDADQGATKSQKKWYEIKKKLAAKKKSPNQNLTKIVDTDMAGGIAKDVDVRPCNQILGIQILHQVSGLQFQTTAAEPFSTYNTAKAHVIVTTPIQIGKTGEVQSTSTNGKTYNACMNIEAMSSQLHLPKKFADAIALNDTETWEPLLQTLYSSANQYANDVFAWTTDEARLSDLCAKMILEAEAEDPNLDGIAIDAYGFHLSTRVRYFYMLDYPGKMSPSETNILDNLQIEEIFQAFSKGEVDDSTTQPYLSSLVGMLTSEAAGPAALRRLGRAFGFAAAYAVSLGSEQTLTKRMAEASTAKNVFTPAASSGSPDPGQFDKVITKQKNLAIDLPDPAMGVLSNKVLEVFYVLVVPLEDFIKRDGFSPSWALLTNFAKQLDDYHFSMPDPAKSFAAMAGFHIYDPASGLWHKMQIDWHPPIKIDEVPIKVPPLNAGGAFVTHYMDSTGHYLPGNAGLGRQDQYILNSYLSAHPLFEVLSQSAKEQNYWLTTLGSYQPYAPSDIIPKFLMGVTNAFGISAATMLSAHSQAFPAMDSFGNPPKNYPNLKTWVDNVVAFSSYVEKQSQINKDNKDPYVQSFNQIQNFASVAALFNPISIGFGTCSIYQTLFSPYDPHLGYSCGDYGYPLLMLYQSDKEPTKTSSLIRNLERMNQWVADQIIPNAMADDSCGWLCIIEKAAGGGDSGSSSDGNGNNANNDNNNNNHGGPPDIKQPSNSGSKDGYGEHLNVPAWHYDAPSESAKTVETNEQSISKQLGLPQGYQEQFCSSLNQCIEDLNTLRALIKGYQGKPPGSGFDVTSDDYKEAFLKHEFELKAKQMTLSPEWQNMYSSAQADTKVIIQGDLDKKIRDLPPLPFGNGPYESGKGGIVDETIRFPYRYFQGADAVAATYDASPGVKALSVQDFKEGMINNFISNYRSVIDENVGGDLLKAHYSQEALELDFNNELSKMLGVHIHMQDEDFAKLTYAEFSDPNKAKSLLYFSWVSVPEAPPINLTWVELNK